MPERLGIDGSSVNKEQFPDLSSKYRTVRYLGSGLNDSGYLVEDQNGQPFVALTPSLYPYPEFNWPKTQRKMDKADLLDSFGLQDYVVHQVDVGRLFLESIGNARDMAMVIVVEYGGKSIEFAQTDEEKVELLKQIWHVTKTINQAGYAIHDFKDEHWLFTKKDDGSIQVKLIDYTKIWKVRQEDINRNQNDHRKGDIRKFVALMYEWFPWFRSQGYDFSNTYDQIRDNIEQSLRILEEEDKSLSKRDKFKRRMINALKSRLGI